MAETARGTKPQDHRKPQGEAEKERNKQIDADAVLADLPELVPAHALRMRDKARFRAILLDVDKSGLFDRSDDEDDEDDEIELDRGSLDPADIEKIKAYDDLAASIDEWAESIAKNPVAYATWAGGKGYNEFFAILNRYQDALGESTGS